MEIAEREHALGKFRRRELSGAGEGRHGLVIEQTVGESIELRRLDPLFLAIELYERDALEEFQGIVSGIIVRGSGSSSRMTNHISGGRSRRPVRPIRCKKELTVNGASI